MRFFSEVDCLWVESVLPTSLADEISSPKIGGFPEVASAALQALWRSALPSRVPLAEDVDFAVLGAYDLDAGGIASAAFRACAKAVLRRGWRDVTRQNICRFNMV